MSEQDGRQKARKVEEMRSNLRSIESSRRRVRDLEGLLESYSRGSIDSTAVTKGGGIRSWFSRRGQSSPQEITLTEGEQKLLREWIQKQANDYRKHADALEERVALGGN